MRVVRRGGRVTWPAVSKLVLVSLCALWLVTFAAEVMASKDWRSSTSQSPGGTQSSDELLQLPDLSAESSGAALTVLPSTVPGWIVQGIQPVPGSNGGVVEGNYTPQDEERSLAMPLVVYVQVIGASGAGVSGADELLARRYTEDQREYEIEGVAVRAGRSADGGSYFITWGKDGSVFGVDATFRYRIPASGGAPVIKKSAEEIAAAVINHRPGQGGSE
jgi:hypothetical protein